MSRCTNSKPPPALLICAACIFVVIECSLTYPGDRRLRMGRARLMFALVIKLFARDSVVFVDRVDRDFFARDALAGGFGGDVEGEVDDKLIGRRAIEER